MSLLERNMQVLRLRHPDLATRMERPIPPAGLTVERARTGVPVVRRNGVHLHSPDDPVAEAAAWASGCAGRGGVTILGCGLGYHLGALAERGGHGAVVEPDAALFRLALERTDLTFALERFRPLVGIPRETLQRSCRDLLAGTVVTHPPSLQAERDYFLPLADFARALPLARGGGLKILLVNPVAGGSLPAARHSAAALRALGHRVEVYESDRFAGGMEFARTFTAPGHGREFLVEMETFLSRGVELKAREFGPDLVISLAQAPLYPATLDELRRMEIPTAFWYVEDYRVLSFWRTVAAGYAHIFTIQHGAFAEELAACGAGLHAYLPTAAAPQVHAPLSLSDGERAAFGSALSFVGAGYRNRQLFFRGLLDYDLKIWGSDWPLHPPLDAVIQRSGGRVDTDDCVRIFNASAVNLNLHSSLHHEGVDPAGDFVNPRTFEIASCNAFQLVDRRSLLADLFAPDEMETFSDLVELRDKIDHYLARPDERRATASRGRSRVLAEHTYEARMEELLARMICSFPIIGEKLRERTQTREALLSGIAGHAGMKELLAAVPAGADATLTDFCRAIDDNEGALSRAERIFLMLRQMSRQGVGP